MLFIKPGVRITGTRPEILLAAVAAERVYEEAGYDFTITARIERALHVCAGSERTVP